MLKRVAIHQPNYLPWLGYFHKMRLADALVLLDTVDFESGSASSVTNRTRIKTPSGVLQLTVPVRRSSGPRIRDVLVANGQDWVKKHLRSIEQSYAKAPHFAEVYSIVAGLLRSPHPRLADLNRTLIAAVAHYLGLQAQLLDASSLPIDTPGRNERLIAICEHLGASVYVSGRGGREYHDEALFARRGIAIEYTSFASAPYPQLHGPFEGGLGVLDALFNCGRRTLDLL